jgi:hypothetical protein
MYLQAMQRGVTPPAGFAWTGVVVCGTSAAGSGSSTIGFFLGAIAHLLFFFLGRIFVPYFFFQRL